MDIRELRIEDRVSHNGDTGEVVEIKTTHTRLLFKDGTSYLYNVNELEPIPITDKLIKKIGFLNINNMWYHLDELVLLRRLKHNYQIYITDCGSHYEINKIIKYLHQLQHEIWEAGIELKIEL